MDEHKQEYFPIARLHRKDLSEVGYSEAQANAVSDADMERIAEKMGSAYTEILYWIDLKIIAEYVLSDVAHEADEAEAAYQNAAARGEHPEIKAVFG